MRRGWRSSACCGKRRMSAARLSRRTASWRSCRGGKKKGRRKKLPRTHRPRQVCRRPCDLLRPRCSSWTKSLCRCCATTGIWSDSTGNRAGAAFAVHRRSTSLRAAEANPHGPACSESLRDSTVASVKWSMPLLCRSCHARCRAQVLMVQTLQKTMEVPQLQLVDSTSLLWCRDRFPWSCSGP